MECTHHLITAEQPTIDPFRFKLSLQRRFITEFRPMLTQILKIFCEVCVHEEENAPVALLPQFILPHSCILLPLDEVRHQDDNHASKAESIQDIEPSHRSAS